MGNFCQLGLVGLQGRYVTTIERLVVDGARGRETERACLDAGCCQRCHARAIICGRRFAVGAALAHHEDTQGRVRHLRDDIEIIGTCLERIEVVLEGLPVPWQAFGEHDLRDVLDTLHELDQHVALLRLARREADTAVADHGRRDAIPGRGRNLARPRDLRIVVGMKIDEPGSDNHPFCVDFLGTTPGDLSDLDDACAGDRHIGVTWLRAGTVEDGAVADDEVETVVHGGCSVATDARKAKGVGRRGQRNAGALEAAWVFPRIGDVHSFDTIRRRSLSHPLR